VNKVFFDVGLSLDGFLAGPNGGPRNPLGDGGLALHEWLFATATFREQHGEPGGEPVADDGVVRATFARTGAYVMGRRMFDEGEVVWPEDAPFRAPVFVLTRRARAPWPRKGGTTFHFVTTGIHDALARAREAAGGKDVRVAGGADTICQFLAAGLIDDFTLHTAPVLLGAGVRLFDDMVGHRLAVEQTATSPGALAAHAHYRVVRAS
jgi:dihydrofolate reductase